MKKLDPGANLFDPKLVLEYLFNPLPWVEPYGDIAIGGGLLTEGKENASKNYQKGLQYFQKHKNYYEALKHFDASKPHIRQLETQYLIALSKLNQGIIYDFEKTTPQMVEKALDDAINMGEKSMEGSPIKGKDKAKTSENDWSVEYFTALALRAKFVLGVILEKGRESNEELLQRSQMKLEGLIEVKSPTSPSKSKLIKFDPNVIHMEIEIGKFLAGVACFFAGDFEIALQKFMLKAEIINKKFEEVTKFLKTKKLFGKGLCQKRLGKYEEAFQTLSLFVENEEKKNDEAIPEEFRIDFESNNKEKKEKVFYFCSDFIEISRFLAYSEKNNSNEEIEFLSSFNSKTANSIENVPLFADLMRIMSVYFTNKIKNDILCAKNEAIIKVFTARAKQFQESKSNKQAIYDLMELFKVGFWK